MSTSWKICAAILLVASGSAGCQFNALEEPEREDQPVWMWEDERIRQFWSGIEAGPALKPSSWPNGAKAAVALSFDYQMGTIYDPANVASSANTNSIYDGRVGLTRILDLLERHEVPASFFITGVTAMLYPETLTAILESGRHEIGVHGWIHERPSELPDQVEAKLLEKSIDAIQTVTGRVPVGYRSPAWEFSEDTLGLLLDHGFLYDSGMMADDDPYEIVIQGESTGLLEIPVEWIRDDAPHFQRGRASSPDAVYEIWSAEFDGAFREGGLFQLTMHPRIMGHRSRALMLEKLIGYMKQHDGVWFATHEQIARYVIESSKAEAGEPGDDLVDLDTREDVGFQPVGDDATRVGRRVERRHVNTRVGVTF
jgi:peptidoglycan/xylan/chitin deacetylase (PgdA/CDA1 family)